MLLDSTTLDALPLSTVRTVPVTEVQPGDLIDTGNALQPGPVIRVAAVAVHAGVVYVARRDSAALVPQGYRFAADQRVDLYAR